MQTKSERKLLSVIVNSLIALNAYVAVEVANGQIPMWLIPLVAVIAIVAQIVKDEYVTTETTKAIKSKLQP
jgi:hypothetical protein